MKATKMLQKQHQEVTSLLEHVRKVAGADERRTVLDRIKNKLETHMTIEEEVFYPAVREAIDTKTVQEMILEAYEAHHVVRLILAEWAEIDPADEQFEAKIRVLLTLIEQHVEDEEKELFKAAQKLGSKRLDQLGEQMQRLVEAGAGSRGEDGRLNAAGGC